MFEINKSMLNIIIGLIIGIILDIPVFNFLNFSIWLKLLVLILIPLGIALISYFYGEFEDF
jgi:hypothetical protein